MAELVRAELEVRAAQERAAKDRAARERAERAKKNGRNNKPKNRKDAGKPGNRPRTTTPGRRAAPARRTAARRSAPPEDCRSTYCRSADSAVLFTGHLQPSVHSSEIHLDTSGRRLVDLTGAVAEFCRPLGDGLVNVFVPHATAGVALMELGSGSEADLVAALDRLLPRDDRYRHRHGVPGHGADHLLPALVSPSMVLPVEGGRVQPGHLAEHRAR